jgi:NADH-quinone oxidoreductase subunit C
MGYLDITLTYILQRKRTFYTNMLGNDVSYQPDSLLVFLDLLQKYYYHLVTSTTVDKLYLVNRFLCIYILGNFISDNRIYIHKSTDLVLPSIAKIFASAIWLERECYDMFGIYFQGSPDLRRILTDYSFKGHPLRKDYSVIGYKERRYSHHVRGLINTTVTF